MIITRTKKSILPDRGQSVTIFVVLQCSVSCGNGKRERTVKCSGGRGRCDSRSEPPVTTSCNLGSCPEWKVGDWSQVKAKVFDT